MAKLADDLIGNLLNAGGLVGGAFAQGRQNDLAEQQGKQQLQLGQMRIQAAQEAQAQAQQYQQDVAAYSANPTPQALAQLMAKYPEQADAIKKSYDVLDQPARDSRMSMLSSLYFAASNNRPDLAAQQIGGIIKAEKSQGLDTSEAEQIQAGLQSPDEATRTAALTQLKAFSQAHLAIADPKAAEAIIGKKESYNLEPGQAHFENGQMVAHSPFVKGEDGAYYNWDDLTKGGGPASGGGSAGSGAPFDPKAFFKSFVLPHEGGYAAHDANGAPVNMGVNQAANPGVDVKNLTADQAADIFATKYAAKAASMPPALAGVYADTAYINPARAEQFLKASGGDPNKFLALRQAWMNSLIAKDPAKYQPYAKAWANRNRDLGQYIAQQGGAQTADASGAPKPLIPGKKKDPPSGYQWAADGKSLEPIPGGPSDGSATTMSPEELNFYAERLASGGDLPPLGMGKDAARLRQQILGKAADIAIDRGISGSQANLLKADLKANTHSLQELTKVRTMVESSERTASLNADQVLKLAPMGVGGNVPLFNRWVQAGRKNISGDPALSRFALALDTVANEYAKVMTTNTGTGGVTSDSARAEAHALLNKSDTLQQLQATIHQMRIDMANRKHALAVQDSILRGNITGLGSAPAQPSQGWGKAVRVK